MQTDFVDPPQPSKPGIWIRLAAWQKGGKVVWLQDHQLKPYLTIALPDPFGGWYCHVYCLTRVGHCKLLPDGGIDPQSESFYIKRWKWA